ncbi:MAG: hypothetical protein LAT78_05980 [Roseinatronobacter sp.]|nr:hypothetical protein [Roseinatronobacter sp.]
MDCTKRQARCAPQPEQITLNKYPKAHIVLPPLPGNTSGETQNAALHAQLMETAE